MANEDPRPGDFRIFASTDPENFPLKDVVSIKPAAASPLFLIDLVDSKAGGVRSLSQGAETKQGVISRLVDDGLIVTFHTARPGGRPIIIGQVEDEEGRFGGGTVVFVAEDDGKGDEL